MISAEAKNVLPKVALSIAYLVFLKRSRHKNISDKKIKKEKPLQH